MAFLSEGKGCVYLDVHVQPGARKPGLVGLHGDALKLAVRAQPQQGRANQEVVVMVAQALGVPPSDLEIVSGQRSRRKRVSVANLGPDQVRTRLAPYLPSG